MHEPEVLYLAPACIPGAALFLTGCHLLAEPLREYSWRNSDVGWFQEEY